MKDRHSHGAINDAGTDIRITCPRDIRCHQRCDPAHVNGKSEDGNPPETALKLVASTGLQWPDRSSGYPMKITEERILANAPLYVMGTLSERRQIPDKPTSFLPRLLNAWASNAPRRNDQSFSAAFRYVSQGARRWLARDLSTLVPQWTPPAVDPHQVVGVAGAPTESCNADTGESKPSISHCF